MTLAVLVVDRDAAMQQRRQPRWIERLGQIDREQGLGLVEQEAAVAVGGGDQGGAGIGGERQRPLLDRLGARQEFSIAAPSGSIEDEHLGAAEQCCVELEGWVFRRRADENDRAVLDVRREAILLGAEMMDLVDEQQRAVADARLFARFRKRLLEVGDPGEDRRDRDEAQADSACQQSLPMVESCRFRAAPTGSSRRACRPPPSARSRRPGR